jgi:antitoxin VapB
MEVVAKVFSTGNSQAIRLPKAFRLDVPEVWLSKDAVTGTITLRPKDDGQRKKNLAELFRLIREQPITEDFIPPRDDLARPNPFADWDAPAPTKPPAPASPLKATKRAPSAKRSAKATP